MENELLIDLLKVMESISLSLNYIFVLLSIALGSIMGCILFRR